MEVNWRGEHLVAIVFGLCFVILSFRGFVFSFFFVRDFYCSFGLFLKSMFSCDEGVLDL